MSIMGEGRYEFRKVCIYKLLGSLRAPQRLFIASALSSMGSTGPAF